MKPSKKMLLALVILSIAPHRVSSQEIEFIRSPNGGVQPRAAVDEAGTTHLVYLKLTDNSGDLYYVTRGPTGGDWSTPIHVNSEAGSVQSFGAIGRAELALGLDGRPHVTWFNMSPPEFWYARLADDGSTFEPQRNLVTENAKGVEAGAAIAADADGNVFLVWHAGDLRKEDQRAVYARRSSDGGKTFGPEQRASPADSGACACCGLSALVDRRGRLLISYRAAGKNVHRDMTLLISEDKGGSFTTRTIHRWELNACPVTTTLLAENNGASPWVSWAAVNRVFFASVDEPTRLIPAPGSHLAGRQKDQALAVNAAGETLLVWAKGRNWRLGGELHWQLFDAEGSPKGGPGRHAEPITDASFPSAIAAPSGGFVVFY